MLECLKLTKKEFSQQLLKEDYQVEVRGQEVEETLTFHMQGTGFRVIYMKPLGQLGERQR